MARILVADDDAVVAGVTARLLARDGHDVATATSWDAARDRLSTSPPELLILDYQLGDVEAPDALAELGGQGLPELPVIVITGKRLSPGDQVVALDCGALDYLQKGVNSQVLLARVRAALRARRESRPLVRGRLRVDLRAGRAWLGERQLDLDRKPFLTLHHLAAHDGVAVSRRQLLEAVWETSFDGFEHAVEQAIYTVRRQLREPGWIETVHGHGYRFHTVG